MTAVNIIPKMETTSTGAAAAAVNHDYTVPTGKRWILTYIELEHSVAGATNTVDIEHPAGTNIWPQVTNFKKMNVDLLVRYPSNGVQLEAADVLRIAFARAVSTTAVSTVYIMERDV